MNDTWLRIPPEAKVEARTTWTLALSTDQHQLGAAVLLLNRPCESVADLTAAEWMDLHTHLQRLHRALEAVLKPDTYDHRLEASGHHQVFMRLVPRYRTPRTWRGETFHGDNGHGDDGRLVPPELLEDLRDAIRNQLPAVV